MARRSNPVRFYRGSYPRFVSEFGFEALPSPSTIATYADPSEVEHDFICDGASSAPSGAVTAIIVTYLTEHFRLPDDFAVTGLSATSAASRGRTHRRRALATTARPRSADLCTGSSTTVGRWLRGPASITTAAGRRCITRPRRFYAPVLLSLFDEGLKVGVHVTSDIAEIVNGQVKWQLVTLNGEVLQSGEEAVEVGPYLSKEITSASFTLTDRRRRQTVFTCTLAVVGSR